jgi:hypothetical protein
VPKALTRLSPSCNGELYEFGVMGESITPNLLVLLFACFLTGALACQRFLHAFLFARLQIKGVTFHFLDDVLGLDFALEPAQRVFERLAFL